MDSVIDKDEVYEVADKMKIQPSSSENHFLVYWDDNSFGIVSRTDLVNIAVSELKADVFGRNCEAMYGNISKHRVTLIYRGNFLKSPT